MEEPLELLLVAGESKDPFSTTVVEPKSCVSCWSFKGSELQGAEIGCVEPVGQNGDLIFIAAKDRPLTHVVAVNSRDRFHVKSVLNKPLQRVAISKDGTVIFGSIGSQISTWMIATGELLSTTNAHYQTITSLCLSNDDGLLISGAADGTINVYLVCDLLSLGSGGIELIRPYREWRVHSLGITSLYVTCSANTRVLSSSIDHTAALHSVSMDECLLKVSGDRPVTASCMDPAETSLFLGTDEGPIVQFPLYSLEGVTEKMITLSSTNSKDDLFFTGHSCEVTRICVNHDASLLASGDCNGGYIVWDAFSRQCLRCVHMKGSICKLQFIRYWDSMRLSDYPQVDIPVGMLQRSSAKASESRKIALKAIKGMKSDKTEKRICDHLSKLIERQAKLYFASSEAQGSQVMLQADTIKAVNINDEVIVEDDAVDTEQNDDGSAESNTYITENVKLKLKNAELLAEVNKLKAELSFLSKQNQDIFEFAADVILENKPK